MKILLINPISSRKKLIKGRAAHFPAGIGFIASYLEQNNIRVDILDNETACLNRHELREYLSGCDHDIFGISAMSPQYSYIKALSVMIKEMHEKKIILGGPLSTYSHETVLKNSTVDFCVIGEGEETVLDLIRNIDHPEKVPGIAYRQNNSVVTTQKRELQKSRDEYPIPAYHLFNMEPYFHKEHFQYEGWGAEYLNRNIKIRNMGITTGIGCPYRCTFCSRSVIKPRLRSVDSIITDIKYCMEHYDIQGVRFIDDILIVSDKRTLELCNKIAPLKLKWSGQARTNTVHTHLAEKMKKAGCIGLSFGYESGSDTMLKRMKKQTTAEKHLQATEAARKNGMTIKVQLMFGLPGENRETLRETIEFYKKSELPPRRFNVLTPLPGSEIYDDCLKKGLIKDENAYLEEVSKMEKGFGCRDFMFNLTEFTDEEFKTVLSDAEKAMEENYRQIIIRKNRFWFLYKIKLMTVKAILWIQRLKKVFNLNAWKRKYDSFFSKSVRVELSRYEIEDLYFNL